MTHAVQQIPPPTTLTCLPAIRYRYIIRGTGETKRKKRVSILSLPAAPRINTEAVVAFLFHDNHMNRWIAALMHDQREIAGHHYVCYMVFQSRKQATMYVNLQTGVSCSA